MNLIKLKKELKIMNLINTKKNYVSGRGDGEMG